MTRAPVHDGVTLADYELLRAKAERLHRAISTLIERWPQLRDEHAFEPQQWALNEAIACIEECKP